MHGNYLVILIVLLAISCSDENLPSGLYDYQVERLLSNDSSKTWIQVVNPQDCSDSVKMLVEAQNDSIDIFNILSTGNCSFNDTIFLGRANASSLEGSLIFSDSLIFSNGNYWLIEELTSKLAILNIDDKQIKYITD